ncbi:alpha-xylosidase [Lactobacillus sp. ESL0263]|uniref:alpha-xylosidase n=1 Tax=Lactobacillus sp. ESL0263 TaxID=2069350 RepID=UPI000EFAD506|nr:alpha-xylosidase [Lactobacillus sp. ESL0263]RMC51481.1 alpha-xylosidase [Lactobacillus sp. ESL0263]
MKYLNGNWLIRDGFSVDYGKSIYDYKIEKSKLTLWLPFKEITDPGMTLDDGMLTVEITAPRKNIIDIKIINFKGEVDHGPNFKLNKDVDFEPRIVEQQDKFVFISDKTSLEIIRGSQVKFNFYYDSKFRAEVIDRSVARIFDPQGHVHVSNSFVLQPGEKIYGLGERFSNFVKNGQEVEIWNRDGGTETTQSYKNIPLYLSNRNYGIFVDTPEKVSYEVASQQVDRVEFSVPSQELSYMFIGGKDNKEVLDHYTALTGRPPLLPAWSYGLWLTTSFTTKYDEKTVMSFINGMLERDIPLSVFHFDCCWMKPTEWCNFEWDPDIFPDPEGLLDKIHNKGIKVCVWINPYIAQKSRLFEEGAQKGYFIKKTNGDVWQWDKWQAGMAIVDFTNPDAVKWYQGYLKELLNQGVDVFKTDFGERIPTKDVQYFDKSDPEKMHNYYPLIYNKIVIDTIAEVKGQKEALVFARSGTVGSQCYPVHWGGDSSSNYSSMAETLRSGLSFGMSGFGYWSHDISGFEENATPDLYNRWTQFGLLSSHSRYHGSTTYKVPWLYGEEAVENTKKFTNLKLKLLPYLMGMSLEAHLHGTPILRSMVLEFPDDPGTEDLDMQYMLGSNLLVAPIFNDQGEAQFYVPETKGKWISILTGEAYESGRWYKQKFDELTLPVLARPNSVIITGEFDNETMYDFTEHPTINVFEPGDGKIEARLTDSYGTEVGKVIVINDGNNLLVKPQNLKTFDIRIYIAGNKVNEYKDLTGETKLSITK